MAWEGPVLGAGLRAVLWAIARYRRYRQGRRKVSVLVHHAFFMDDVGASPLTTPPNMVVNWSVPATGTGGVGGERLLLHEGDQPLSRSGY
jgi:hypothetical protein